MTAMHEPLLAVAPLPDPPVPADVDLRDFAFMPLDVLRLRDSELACVEDAEVFRCAVLSWCVAWHQVPAGSLPDDDAVLARLLGFGRDVTGWRRVRAAGGMRGWTLCADGRLYHDVVAEKARDAWAAKQAQRARTEAARKAREEARQRQSQSLSQTPQTSVTDLVTESKGQGEGQGIERHSPSPDGDGGAPAKPGPAAPRVPNVDHEAVVGAYHELLPDHPRVVQWTDSRQALLRKRWRELAVYDAKRGKAWPDTAAGVARFRKFFTFVGESRFLTGRTKATGDRPPFVADLEWLLRPTNFLKVVEGKFHAEA